MTEEFDLYDSARRVSTTQKLVHETMSNCLTKQMPEQLEASPDSKLSQNFPPNKFPLNRQVLLHIPKITSTRTTCQILHALLQVRKRRMRTKLPTLGVSKHKETMLLGHHDHN